MVLMAIKETSKVTGLSQYEIRKRIRAGSCPHIRVGAKGTKYLILFDEFIKELKRESTENILFKNSTYKYDTDATGYSQIRKVQ